MADYHGKSILLVGGGLLQVPAVRIARELGLQTIVTDRHPDAPAMQICDCAVAIDTKDAKAHIALARKTKNLAAVFTQGHSVEYTVAATADAVGLLSIGKDSAFAISNKIAMRHELGAAGIAQPRWEATNDYDMARGLARGMGYPVILKASDNSGSRGASKVYSADDLTRTAFERARVASSDGCVLIEELLEPPSDFPRGAGGEPYEQSVETLWVDGKGYWLNWVDRVFASARYYAIELGHINPAQHDDGTFNAVRELVMKAGRALGMTNGIFKCDIMLTDNGPMVLETTARLSGGFDAQYTSPLAHGVNYIRGAMRQALGERVSLADDDFRTQWHEHSVAWAAFPQPGRVTRVDTSRALQIAGVKHVFPRVQVGDVIEGYRDCTSRPCFVISQGDTREEALRAAVCGANAMEIETTERLKDYWQ